MRVGEEVGFVYGADGAGMIRGSRFEAENGVEKGPVAIKIGVREEEHMLENSKNSGGGTE